MAVELEVVAEVVVATYDGGGGGGGVIGEEAVGAAT